MMQNITFNGFHLPTVAKTARELGSPTDSDLAALIWRLSNAASLPVEIATDFMREAGYEPFKGFPLQRRKI